MTVEIHLLEQLDALARKGTLSAASEELHLTQPTLTRSMQKLEQQIGAPLFERESKKIRLNENGLLAADYARRILSLEEEMIRHIQLQERNRSIFSFGAVCQGPIIELVPQLTEMLAGKPILAETQDEDLLIKGLKRGQYTMISLGRPLYDNNCFCIKTCKERISYTYVPTGDHPVSTEGVYFRDINGRNILMSTDVGFWGDIVRRNMPDSNILVQEHEENINIIADNSTIAAFSSDIAIRHGMNRPGRIAVPILDDEAEAFYYCICRASDANTKSLIKILAEHHLV